MRVAERPVARRPAGTGTGGAGTIVRLPHDARGAFIEVGTGRRFCPACCSDILACSHIKEGDFLPGSDDEPDTLPIHEFIPEE